MALVHQLARDDVADAARAAHLRRRQDECRSLLAGMLATAMDRSAEAQARVGVEAIRSEFASAVGQDGGFATIAADRDEADAIATAVVDEAFPGFLPVDHDDLCPRWQVLDGRKGAALGAVRAGGMPGRRRPIRRNNR